MHDNAGRPAVGNAEQGMMRVGADFAAMVLLLLATPAWAQQPQTPAPSSAAGNAAQSEPAKDKTPDKKVTGSNRRRATKLYLRASKLFEKQQYDEALRDYQEAAELDPGNPNYGAATVVARSHEVTELI